MPPTLASLVQHSALKLTVRAGADRLDTPVRWAHASELADPVPYMDGGELLLVTATNLDAENAESMRRYVRRLAGAGVAGVGFAVGVNYEEIPAALLDAAEEAGLPVLEVPRRTPFLAISKAVSAAIAADQYRAVTAGFEAQRELTKAALAGDGPADLLARLAAHVDGWAALYDTSGAVLAAAPDWAARRAARLTPDVERLRDRPAPASVVVGDSEDRVELQSLGTGRRARGALAVGTGAALGTAERYAVHSAVALLTLTTARSRSLQGAEQRLGAAVLRMLLAGQPDHARAVAGDLYGGLLDAPFRLLIAEAAAPAGFDLLTETMEAAAARSGEALLMVPEGERVVSRRRGPSYCSGGTCVGWESPGRPDTCERTRRPRTNGSRDRRSDGRARCSMAIEVGDEAPDFELKDNHGRTVRLADFRGEKNVVLLFYPFAFTGVCTGELCALRDELPRFENDDTQLLAVSNDSIHTLRVFAEQEGLEYPLLSDFWPHGETSRAYGVFDEDKGCAVRGTFIIDKAGTVRWSVVNGLPDARDLNDYIKALEAL
ncbi:redoxin domain-containing protein [Streptomyces cyaneofuscatus]|uniref:redoxin domain-containing protein n=4 Tax=Streptomyces TaxID=1883 RepID=UPI0033A13ED6